MAISGMCFAFTDLGCDEILTIPSYVEVGLPSSYTRAMKDVD